MNQTNSSFTKILLVLAIIAAIVVIIYLILGENETVYKNTVDLITPTEVIQKADDINTIDTDYSQLDQKQFEENIDTSLEKIGTESTAF